MDYNKAIKESKCFGLAYDPTVEACKRCSVAFRCKAETLGEIPAPDRPDVSADTTPVATPTKVKRPEPRDLEEITPAVEEPKPSEPAKRPKKSYSDDMPTKFSTDLDELIKLAQERKVAEADINMCLNYVDEKIRKMRLVMAIKKTYEI